MSRSKHTVRLLPSAEEDLADIISYIAADRITSARALADRIEKNLKLLSANPRLGRVPAEKELADSGYRFLIVENYLIFYVIEGKTIYVHRIIHGARDYLAIL